MEVNDAAQWLAIVGLYAAIIRIWIDLYTRARF